MDLVRLDKYLWAIRAFKSRNDATEACKGNKVHVNDAVAKPSKMIKAGDILTVRKGPVMFTYRVKALIENRVGAKLVPDYAEDLTPQAELDKMHAPSETFFVRRDRGAGRPTKRDRRIMDEMMDNLSYSEDSDFGEDF